MISFDNTSVAFKGKSNAELRRSYWLFRIVANSSLVKLGQKFTNFAIKYHLPVKWLIKPTIFKQFCGGEDIHECLNTIDNLGTYNIGSILDYSVEGKEKESDFDHAADEIIKPILLAKNNPHIPFAVFKPSGLGSLAMLEKVSSGKPLSAGENSLWIAFKSRVDNICRKAYECKVRLLIDAEETWTQGAIDNLVQDMMFAYNKEKCLVFNTVQLYRKDRMEYLMKVLKDARERKFLLGMKLVRGAYMEKERERAEKLGYPSPINDTKEDTDKMYNEALKFCVENIDVFSICVGTHNEDSAMLLVNLMEQHHIQPDDSRIWFSQLLGMSDHISFNAANTSYNVAKYVPYGPIKNVLPYLIRRAQENTSVKGQTSRELNLILTEKERRSASLLLPENSVSKAEK
ncbi:MAG: proline dehydrogenase family protein [Bacteroidia bacterium]